jgi:hypothetical protein
MELEQCQICNIIENARWFHSVEQAILMAQRMDLIYSLLDTLYEFYPHASHSWTEQSYVLPVQFAMTLQNSIHILIG